MSWGDPVPAEGAQAEAPTPGERGVVASGLAMLMGIISILMSGTFLANLGFFVLHFAYLRDPNAQQGPSWRTLVFQVTGRWWITGLFWWLGVAWGLAYTGYRMALTRREPGRPGSLAATAARFSAWGLWGCGLGLASIAAMLAYRWTR